MAVFCFWGQQKDVFSGKENKGCIVFSLLGLDYKMEEVCFLSRAHSKQYSCFGLGGFNFGVWNAMDKMLDAESFLIPFVTRSSEESITDCFLAWILTS